MWCIPIMSLSSHSSNKTEDFNFNITKCCYTCCFLTQLLITIDKFSSLLRFTIAENWNITDDHHSLLNSKPLR